MSLRSSRFETRPREHGKSQIESAENELVMSVAQFGRLEEINRIIDKFGEHSKTEIEAAYKLVMSVPEFELMVSPMSIYLVEIESPASPLFR